MYDTPVFHFVKKLLNNFHIPNCFIDYSQGKIPADVDLGLRSLLYGVDGYENILSNSLTEAKDNVIYRFSDEYRCNYIFFKFPNAPQYFFVGPYLTRFLTEVELSAIFKKLNPNADIFRQFVAYYNSLPILDDENLLLGLLNSFGQTLWGTTENFTMEYLDYPIPDGAPPINVWNFSTSERTDSFSLSAIEEHYKNEQFLMKAVAKGELHKVNAILSSVFNNGTEERLSDSLRNRKNYLIILNTLLRKAAENGGVHPFHIHVFSSKYAKKIESVYSVAESIKLQAEMIREYCIFVRQKSVKQYSFYVGKAITLIAYDLTADLSLKKIAETLNVNASYLSSLFSKEFGCTLTDYVHNQRVEEGMRQLLQTAKTVAQIAVDCGFNDVHYFIRCFKKRTGATPTEYRKTHS